MRRCGAWETFVALLLVSLVVPTAWSEQYYLYSPKPVGPDEQGQTKDGILVREVPVQKGDSLYKISRKLNGRGLYYPQILLFNDLKNPNLIYPGDILRIPLNKGKTTEVSEEKPQRHKKAKRKSRRGRHSVQAVLPAAKQPKPQPKAGKGAVSGQQPMELSISELKKLEGSPEKKRAERKKTNGERAVQKERHKAKQPAGIEPTVKAPKEPVQSDETGRISYMKGVQAFQQGDFQRALNLFDRYLAEHPNSSLAADASLYKAECYLKLSGQ